MKNLEKSKLAIQVLCGVSALLGVLKLFGLFPFSWWIVIAPAAIVPATVFLVIFILGFNLFWGLGWDIIWGDSPRRSITTDYSGDYQPHL